MELTELSATELARAIRTGTVSAVEVVDAHIARLVAVNPVVNAVVTDRFEAARREAEAADARVAAGGVVPPLLGVPVTVKESIAVAGMPHTAGLVARRGVRATESAPIVRRLIKAGAIVLGVTNTSELCLWIEAENRLYGRTRNPYDPARTAGGSSGGEGAAVGSGGSPIGLASDIGGSIRIPAFCCGVFGHKPSRGLLPSIGNYPPVGGSTAPLFANGLLARRAEDLLPVLHLLAGEEGPADGPSLRGLTVVVPDGAWPLPTSDELLYARERAAGALAAAGARVEHRRMPALRWVTEWYVTTLARNGEQSARELVGMDPSWLSLLRRGGPHTMATRVLLLAERAQGRIPTGMARRMIRAGEALAAGLCDAVGDGVLLHPPLASAAPRHGRTVAQPWWLGHAVPFNLAGLPVTQVPLGLNRAGLPLGVQVAGGPGRDGLTIAVARELERVFGGWVPPPLAVAPPGRSDWGGRQAAWA